MNDIEIKFKYIYLRYLIISAGTLIFYSSFNILFFQTEIILLNEGWQELLIPCLLPWPALIFWLRPRLKLLRFNRTGQNDPLTFYIIVAAVFVIVPVCIVQTYISAVAGKISSIKTINNLDKNHLTKFYKIDHYYLDKLNSVIEINQKVSGKHNEYLNFEVYVAIPIYDRYIPTLWDSLATVRLPDTNKLIILDGLPISRNKLSTISPKLIASVNNLSPERGYQLYRIAGANGVLQLFSKKNGVQPYNKGLLGYRRPKAWLGWKQTEQISNKLSTDSKKIYFKQFLKNSEQIFEKTDLNGFTYLAKTGINNDRKNYTKAILNADLWELKKPVIFEPKYSAFEDRGGNKLAWIIFTFLSGSIIWFMMIAFRSLIHTKAKLLVNRIA
ncbi:hypothetical protein ACS5PU_22135 [Pedobacter sp. GSP4]|uniref:hypothetical protein n=1 Tax=Pedobacter sp. GSP4 TaxID=3453716 RepID=UPI003EEFF246